MAPFFFALQMRSHSCGIIKFAEIFVFLVTKSKTLSTYMCEVR